jgi:hypothetical protein
MDRKQFTFYESFASALGRIKSKTARCDAYDAICSYALYGREPDLDSLPDAAAIAFELIRPTLDTSKRKAQNGLRGGSKTEANDKQTESKAEANRKQTVSEKENEKEGEIEKEKENEIEIENECYIARTRSRFAPPTLAEVSAYCNERGNHVDPERFVDFYTSNGWKVGKNSMKDWKAAVRTWEKDDKPQAKQTGKMTTFYDVAQKMKEEGLV